MNVIVVGGGWSTNIGNSFFNVGTLYILQKVMPNAEIFLLSSPPAYLDYLRHRAPRNSLNIFSYVEPDYLVLHGSVLTRYLPAIWEDSLRRMRQKGTKVIFISSGLFEYSESEVEICKRFLERNRPFLFVSRDSDTYKEFSCFAEHSYNGIDSAFFLPDVFVPMKIGLSPYIILNFDKSPEPFIRCSANSSGPSMTRRDDSAGYSTYFEFKNKIWRLKFPFLRYCIAKRLSKFYPYFESLMFSMGTKPRFVDDYMVVRVDHQCNPLVLRKLFRYPNSFCWDIPYPYICLYANAEFTLTDRVHAAVVTLTYGKPAMLFSESGRSRILERVGAKNLHRELHYLDQETLRREKKSMLEFLSEALGS